MARIFAADGYVLTATDYIGLDVSTLSQACFHRPSTVSAIVELVSPADFVAQIYGASLDGVIR